MISTSYEKFLDKKTQASIMAGFDPVKDDSQTSKK